MVECDVRNVEAAGSKPAFSNFFSSWILNAELSKSFMHVEAIAIHLISFGDFETFRARALWRNG